MAAREKLKIVPELEDGNSVVLNFDGVDAATQSFVHALISDLFRNYGSEVLDKVEFKHCSETVQKIIIMVTEYMQEA